MKGYVLSVEQEIEASPAAIFAVLSDARNHSMIDGSGMLQGSTVGGPELLTLGSTFGMRMKMGVRYSTVNRIVEFDQNRCIAWRTGPEGRMGKFVAGRTWRYEMERSGTRTLVRESWDISTDHQRFLLKLGNIYSRKTRRDMERTLIRLNALLVE